MKLTIDRKTFAKSWAVVAGLAPDIHCLGLTKDGHPKHPLYVPADTKPVIYHGKPL